MYSAVISASNAIAWSTRGTSHRTPEYQLTLSPSFKAVLEIVRAPLSGAGERSTISG